jgi:hypothetical protein
VESCGKAEWGRSLDFVEACRWIASVVGISET